MKYLTLYDIKIEKPEFQNSKLSKGATITLWLIDWVKYSLEHGIADIGDFIPSKDDLALFFGVSVTTVQNSIREVKNLGYFISKQSKGTCIADFYAKDIQPDNKLYCGTVAECKIKKIIIDEKIELNSPIISIKKISEKTNISQNTVRFALVNLETQGYLEKKIIKGKKHKWIYKKEIFLSDEEMTNGIKDEDFTLTHQLVNKIQKYIEKTYKQNEKIHPNQTFSAMFNVSIKTVNDAMKILNAKKIVLSRRGKYGTIYLGNQKKKNDFITTERKKINSTQDFIYSWQKALIHLKKYIQENYEEGDKIAPIRELASILNISPNTVRRALRDLFKNGNIISKRGKSGGIFVVEMPQAPQETYQWLAINPSVIDFNN